MMKCKKALLKTKAIRLNENLGFKTYNGIGFTIPLDIHLVSTYSS